MAILGKNEGIFAVLDAILIDGPAMVAQGIGKGFGALREGFSGGGGELTDAGSSFSLAAMFGSGGDKSPEIAPARVQEVAIAAPVVAPDRFTVGMDELGTFAPPAVGTASRGGMGVGV